MWHLLAGDAVLFYLHPKGLGQLSSKVAFDIYLLYILACFYRLYSNHLMLSFFDTLRQMIYSHDSIGQFVRTTINPNAKLENGKFRAIAALEAICTYFAFCLSSKSMPYPMRESP